MQLAILLALALPMEASIISHVIDLPDAAVTGDDAAHSDPLLIIPFTFPKYTGDPSVLTGITMSYSGHMDAGFSWELLRDGTDLEFVLSRLIWIQLDAKRPGFGMASLTADPVTLAEWDASTVLDYPSVIDQDFAGASGFDPFWWSFFVGNGTHTATLRMFSQSEKSHGCWYGCPVATTAISGLQLTVAYTTHSPEPGTGIAGVALIGLLLHRRSWRRRSA